MRSALALTLLVWAWSAAPPARAADDEAGAAPAFTAAERQAIERYYGHEPGSKRVAKAPEPGRKAGAESASESGHGQDAPRIPHGEGGEHAKEGSGSPGKSGELPPGLAKRGQLPPGLAKRDVLPPGLAKRDLPRDLESQLPVRRKTRRWIVGDDVVLVEVATGKVLDRILGVVAPPPR
jgi:hypothetical protein